MQSLEYPQLPTFALLAEKITGSVTSTSGSQITDHQKFTQPWPGGYYKFSDEGGRATKGDMLYFMKPDDVPQYDWFAPNKTAGLTKAGLARINESIEAFVYCILGAQVT